MITSFLLHFITANLSLFLAEFYSLLPGSVDCPWTAKSHLVRSGSVENQPAEVNRLKVACSGRLYTWIVCVRVYVCYHANPISFICKSKATNSLYTREMLHHHGASPREVVSSGGAPTPAGTSVFPKHSWDMGMGYLWLNGWDINHSMGGAFMGVMT